PLFADKSLICTRCLRNLQFRQFRIFNNNRISLNVTKILGEIQNHKTTLNKNKKCLTDSASRRLTKASKLTNSRDFKLPTSSRGVDIANKSDANVKRPDLRSNEFDKLTITPTKTGAVTQVEFDNSIDIFK